MTLSRGLRPSRLTHVQWAVRMACTGEPPPGVHRCLPGPGWAKVAPFQLGASPGRRHAANHTARSLDANGGPTPDTQWVMSRPWTRHRITSACAEGSAQEQEAEASPTLCHTAAMEMNFCVINVLEQISPCGHLTTCLGCAESHCQHTRSASVLWKHPGLQCWPPQPGPSSGAPNAMVCILLQAWAEPGGATTEHLLGLCPHLLPSAPRELSVRSMGTQHLRVGRGLCLPAAAATDVQLLPWSCFPPVPAMNSHSSVSPHIL